MQSATISLSAPVFDAALIYLPDESPRLRDGKQSRHAVVGHGRILRIMNREELEGVLANEIRTSKIRYPSAACSRARRRLMMLAKIPMAGFLAAGGTGTMKAAAEFSGLIIMSVVAPIAAMIIRCQLPPESFWPITRGENRGNPLGMHGVGQAGERQGRDPVQRARDGPYFS